MNATQQTEPHFAFGKNWRAFLRGLNEDRIAGAEASLKQFLGMDDLEGKTFLDIGSGSGLSSLVARRLGAKVRSFDYDAESVACTAELRRRYFPDDPDWEVSQGDALDAKWLSDLGRFDIVYSWGVLHHTGSMWAALDNVAGLVKPSGKLFIAIYNDQGRPSRWWLKVKKAYNWLPAAARPAIVVPAIAYMWGPASARDLLIGKPFATLRGYATRRGMSPYYDIIDWVGGYPFEVAKPEQIFDFYSERGFELLRMKTCAGYMGCNEFLFRPKGDTSGQA